MKPIASTAEVLAFRVLNRFTSEVWINWAYDMLVIGFETEHLLILAGIEEPLDYFEMRKITNKVFCELNLDYADNDKVIAEYASYLANEGLTGKMEPVIVLDKLKDIYIELEYYRPLQHFYMLYFAKEDLKTSEDQWYVTGLDRSNIDQAINDYFKEWVS